MPACLKTEYTIYFNVLPLNPSLAARAGCWKMPANIIFSVHAFHFYGFVMIMLSTRHYFYGFKVVKGGKNERDKYNGRQSKVLNPALP